MARQIGIGVQAFAKLRENHYFYVDKTDFIKKWWNSGDDVTLITRPRRFGKTITMDMLNCFFSIRYEGRSDLFEGLKIWNDEKFRKLQGTYPVIFFSFAGIKENTYEKTRLKMNKVLEQLYEQYAFLLDSDRLSDREKLAFQKVNDEMNEVEATVALNQLSIFLEKHYGKKVLIFLDEYDTPMQEAYMNGYWSEMVSFIRSMFNNTFKTNPSMERAIMTGITRVSKESIFSDLNNLVVITTTSNQYADSFGFTEEEVFAAIDEWEIPEVEKAEVKEWYDGFTFGNITDIYNPWSITHYLKNRKFDTYWANTSSNSLVGMLLKKGSRDIKIQFEDLLYGKEIECELDEEIVFSDLDEGESAVWSLLLAGGYLKFSSKQGMIYRLVLTNYEVKQMFQRMVKRWFAKRESDYNHFIKSLLNDDVEAMNGYMNRVTMSVFSSFDTGNKPSEQTEPERFYHGFVLGLLVELSGRYYVTSNRESGFGRYDVCLEPVNKQDAGIILEFKVHNPAKEATLEDTVQAALKQVEEKKYAQGLTDRGISKIRSYGFAFEGKTVLIG